MFCKNCGKAIEQDSKFCPNCGTNLIDELPTPSPHVTGAAVPAQAKPVLPMVVVALVLVIVGAGGYWAWNSKVASDEALHQRGNEELARKATDINTAEIKAAQILLEKHIEAEEAQAQANTQGAARMR